MPELANPGGLSGHGDVERTQRFTAWFWRTDSPAQVKFALEKSTRMLLEREPVESGALVYEGASQLKDPSYSARLRLEAVQPKRHLYSLEMEAAASARWFTAETLEKMAWNTMQRWTAPLETTPPPQSLISDAALYLQVVRETLEREAETAGDRSAEAPARNALQALVDNVTRDKCWRRVDKEGMTTFRFDGRRFVREHMGDWEESEVFPNVDAFLADLRKFYDWEIRRDTYPHSPPESEIWKFLLERLE